MALKIIVKGHSSKGCPQYNNIMVRNRYCIKRAHAVLGRRYFVNTLINHLEALKAYEELKLKLAIEDEETPLVHTKVKAEFIGDIIEKIRKRAV